MGGQGLGSLAPEGLDPKGLILSHSRRQGRTRRASPNVMLKEWCSLRSRRCYSLPSEKNLTMGECNLIEKKDGAMRGGNHNRSEILSFKYVTPLGRSP